MNSKQIMDTSEYTYHISYEDRLDLHQSNCFKRKNKKGNTVESASENYSLLLITSLLQNSHRKNYD